MPKAKGSPVERALFGARIEADLYKKVKHYAVDHRLKLRDLLERALQQYLDANPEEAETRGRKK